MENLTFNIYSIILISGGMHGFLLSIYILTRFDRERRALIFLVVLILSIVFISFEFALKYSNYLIVYPQVTKISLPLWFLIGPSIFLYSKYLLNPSKKFDKSIFLHLIPALIIILIYIPYFILPSETKVLIAEGSYIFSYLIKANWMMLFMYMFITPYYIFYSKREVNKFEEIVKKKSSNTDIEYIDWLNLLLKFFLLFALFDMIITLIMFLTDTYLVVYEFLSLCINSFFVYIIAYKTINKPKLFFGNDKDQKDKYENSGFNEAEILNLKIRLEEIMLAEKPYLNSELRLGELAKVMNLTNHKLSQLINQGFNTNFYDYINKYRITDAKRLLVDPEFNTQTILWISYEVGFRSISSFNRIFKNQTGHTPSEFIKINRVNKSA